MAHWLCAGGFYLSIVCSIRDVTHPCPPISSSGFCWLWSVATSGAAGVQGAAYAFVNPKLAKVRKRASADAGSIGAAAVILGLIRFPAYFDRRRYHAGERDHAGSTALSDIC
jgi:hypothetical protein